LAAEANTKKSVMPSSSPRSRMRMSVAFFSTAALAAARARARDSVVSTVDSELIRVCY